jgi:hypothetical protein
MMQLRWLEYHEEEYPVIPPHEIQYGKTYEKVLVTKRKLQFRAYQNNTIYAGMPDQDFINRNAKMSWGPWQDIPTVTED